MRLASLHLQNFKRFSDLRIEGVPDSAKLVLLVGSNGCGKSSVFSALGVLAFGANREGNGGMVSGSPTKDGKYLQKVNAQPWSIDASFQSGLALKASPAGVSQTGESNFLYGRSSIRTVPELSLAGDATRTIATDGDRPTRFTRHDRRMEADVAAFAARIDSALRKPVFDGQQADTLAIFDKEIRPLNEAFARVFQADESVSIRLKNYENSDPRKPVQLLFAKGESVVPFDLLSHGEKQVVTLLLNLQVRGESFPEAVYFIDEMDLHLHTKLQKALLAEIVEQWIPEGGQLWTASHALGFIEYAEDSDHAEIIDFDELDFDLPQRLLPVPKSSFEVFEIAVPKESLARLLEGRHVVYCEGNDHSFYNLALADTSYFFLPANSANDVWARTQAEPGTVGLRDRDFLMASDIAAIQPRAPNYRTLPYYSIESLFYHPENLAEVAPPRFDLEEYIASLVQRRDSAPLRDIKYARDRIRELRDCQLLGVDPKPVYDAYESPEFETFYPYLALKKPAPAYLAELNLQKEDLARTAWFRESIRKVLELEVTTTILPRA